MESSVTTAFFFFFLVFKNNNDDEEEEEVWECSLLVYFTSCHFHRAGGPESVQNPLT